MLGGVCAGLARRLGLDATLVRVAWLVITVTGGLGILLYAVAWALLPAGGDGRPIHRAGTVRIAIGTGLLAVGALLALRELGLWVGDGVVWPVVLTVTGALLVWRQSRPATDPERPRDAAAATSRRDRAGAVSRAGVGIALIAAGGLLILSFSGALEGGVGSALLTVLVIVMAVGIVLAPFAARFAGERAARIRSQERAEVAAHLHDSVLQTLALVQQRASDPAEVAALARRQERELRAWLSGAEAARPDERLADALRAAAGEVEDDHRVPVDVVCVGDRPLDARGEALVAAAREAMVNAARHAGHAGPVSVFAEAVDGRAEVFVRDRGPGFDPGAVPPDRRGVRESIVGRMARHGGRATVGPAPGGGTEVELVLEDG
jgi:phage shock protein PspC (stress-responsive transcriptional regulator)/signal transduction histidine kinase